MPIKQTLPTALIYNFASGAAVSGVEPSSPYYRFKFENLAGGSFAIGDSVSWSTGTGTLVQYNEETAVTGPNVSGIMALELATGVAPVPGDTISVGLVTADAIGDVEANVVLNTGESIERGRYLKYYKLTDGGLVDFPKPFDGFRVISVLATLPGVTAINCFVVDQDGSPAFASGTTLTTGNGYLEWRNGGVLVPPSCKFKVVGAGTLSSAGQIMFVLGKDWGPSVFEGFPGLGKQNLPPGMQ